MRKIMMAAAAAATLISVPAVGQVAGGLVTVQVADIDVLRNSLNNNDVRILNNSDLVSNNQLAAPINVQVPVGIAANVCGISVLAARQLTGPCTATNASRALGQAVAKQKLNQRPAK
ncbi:MAG: hypothetical protein ACJ8E3_06915 [Sphingomicrobium sp.]